MEPSDSAADRLNPLRKLDSTVVLERQESTSSSTAYLRQSTLRRASTLDPDSEDKIDETEKGKTTPALTPVGLDVSIRFDRLGLLLALAVCTLCTFTLVFKDGVVLGHFDPKTKDLDAQKKVVDNYNSYTGNVVSAVGRPIEIVVALAVHVVLLRVITASLLRAEISWKTDLMRLALTAAIGFLVTNSLNALNVQPQAPDIQSMISAVDLTFIPDFSLTDAASRSSNLTTTFPERSRQNPITNTVLRNLVLPRVPPRRPLCDELGDARTLSFSLPDLVLEYGFPQRDWQSRFLQEALEPKQLELVVNPTTDTPSHAVQASDLPMNASLAADLFVHAMFVAPVYFFLLKPENYANRTDIEGRYPNGGSDSAARVLGLMPPAAEALDEAEQREWFLRESVTMWSRHLDRTTNISKSDVTLEFSHVDISPTMRFDAVSIDIEVDPMRVADARSKDNSTGYNVLDPLQCGPWPMRCMLRSPGRAKKQFDSTPFIDIPAQVNVFGVCVSASGTEELTFDFPKSLLSEIPNFLKCSDTSNTSLTVMTIGKRFVAESVAQNKTANASGVFDTSKQVLVTNLRRIYTLTIARLSWELSDLTVAFNANCSTDVRSCNGLRFPLIPTTVEQSQKQELIVGASALPTNLVSPLVIGSMQPQLPLVVLHEPTTNCAANSCKFAPMLAADPLLPHNVQNVTWDRHSPSSGGAQCMAFLENRLQVVFNSHMYIEDGLQTAYTAATFFLLQNAVVKDVITLADNKTSLNFEQNKQRVALLASIPAQNAWLTLGGPILEDWLE